ncbi:hypothetical protein DSLASN_10590 [Desulfoluna limicola]|uniref:Uncharacterized protein n=1 Tax=Desulfoluna limicola TaxID=2810562 RepID=A0ABN6EYP4_9BACT|nr:hypothetical protein [Desulfoluna limicola]BCS95427.1 hypothetical protein DSLASN_10590 [Desulfoluna limicola]
MKSLLNMSRRVFLLLAALCAGYGVAMASSEAPMKMPLDGDCQPPYILFEGVCILPAAAQGEPASIMKKINAFKADPANQASTPSPASNPVEDPLCAKYKQMLADYTKKHVTTYNPEMSEIESSRGQARDTGIIEAKEYLINFCKD